MTTPGWTRLASPTTQVTIGRHLQLSTDCSDTSAGSPTTTSSKMSSSLSRDIFFLGDDPASIPGTKSLIKAGILDSTGILELIGSSRGRFEIRIADDELMPENLTGSRTSFGS